MRIDTGRLRVVGGETLEPAQAEDGAPPSPGAYIREHRERRGMSLEELAIATKVPRSSLELVEADRFDELPGMVFAKGFLRCCARVLALDEDTVLGLMYEQERRAPAREGDRRAGRRKDTHDLVVPASRVPSAASGLARFGRDASGPAPKAEGASGVAATREGAAAPPGAGADGSDEASASRSAVFGDVEPQLESAASHSGLAMASSSAVGAGAAKQAPAPTAPAASPQARIVLPRWILALRDRFAAPRIMLWILVALFVVLIVFLAFTIASGQRGGTMRL